LPILWSNQAAVQLEAAYDFVWEENPSAAEKLLEIIRRAVSQLPIFLRWAALVELAARESWSYKAPHI
jgi:plasmid stabilization system protein ParE